MITDKSKKSPVNPSMSDSFIEFELLNWQVAVALMCILLEIWFINLYCLFNG